MITFEKFYKTIAEAIGGHVTFDSHGEPRISKGGRQVVWLQGDDRPGSKLADIGDLLNNAGRSYTRCYMGDDTDGSIFVWDNLSSDYDEREGQILIFHGKSLKAAIKRALAYNPFTDSKKFPIWD